MSKHVAAIVVLSAFGVLMAVLVVYVVRFSMRLTRERERGRGGKPE
ncbi:MAG: hypothetical protein ACRDZP_05595 [Acidimicrobiales bacterium]